MATESFVERFRGRRLRSENHRPRHDEGHEPVGHIAVGSNVPRTAIARRLEWLRDDQVLTVGAVTNVPQIGLLVHVMIENWVVPTLHDAIIADIPRFLRSMGSVSRPRPSTSSRRRWYFRTLTYDPFSESLLERWHHAVTNRSHSGRQSYV